MKKEISIAFQTDKSPAEYIALARQVDQYAFDAVSVYCDAPFQPSFGPLLLMAPHLKRARLGPAGVSPARMQAIDMAANTALLAGAAAGGAYLGIVRGAWLAEHGLREPDRPLQTIRDMVGAVRYLLSGRTGGYDSPTVKLAAHVSAPYPLPDEMPPILLGTWGRKMAALAGEVADEVKIGGTANPDMIPIMRDYIAVGEAKAGREAGEVSIVVGAVTVIDADRAAARAAVRRDLALYLPVVLPLDPTLEADPAWVERLRGLVNAGDLDTAAQMIPDDLLDRVAIAGNPADVIAHAERLFAAGAGRIEFGTPHGLQPTEGIRLLGEQVLPALGKLLY